eukprot:Pgem_evm1s7111
MSTKSVPARTAPRRPHPVNLSYSLDALHSQCPPELPPPRKEQKAKSLPKSSVKKRVSSRSTLSRLHQSRRRHSEELVLETRRRHSEELVLNTQQFDSGSREKEQRRSLTLVNDNCYDCGGDEDSVSIGASKGNMMLNAQQFNSGSKRKEQRRSLILVDDNCYDGGSDDGNSDENSVSTGVGKGNLMLIGGYDGHDLRRASLEMEMRRSSLEGSSSVSVSNSVSSSSSSSRNKIRKLSLENEIRQKAINEGSGSNHSSSSKKEINRNLSLEKESKVKTTNKVEPDLRRISLN